MMVNGYSWRLYQWQHDRFSPIRAARDGWALWPLVQHDKRQRVHVLRDAGWWIYESDGRGNWRLVGIPRKDDARAGRL